MSSQRTPPSGFTASGSGSSSSPDLLALQAEDRFVTSRYKRKQPELELGIREEITEFRTEIMNFLKDFSLKQSENSNKLCQELTEVKNELISIKRTTETLNSEQSQIKTELEKLKTQNSKYENQIKALESDLTNLKTQQNPALTNLPQRDYEAMALEFQDRAQRQQNVIIIGIPETNNKNSDVRREYDNNQILTLIKSFYKDCPTPMKCMRLGKYNSEKNRHLKVCFENKNTVLHILRNKSKLVSDSVRIYSD